MSPSANAGDAGLIPGLGRSSEEENGNPLQCSCLENLLDRGVCWATFHELQRVGYDWMTEHACMHEIFLSFFHHYFWFYIFFFSSGFRNSLCVRRLMTLFTIYIANVVSFFIICLLNLPIIFCHEKYFK